MIRIPLFLSNKSFDYYKYCIYVLPAMEERAKERERLKQEREEKKRRAEEEKLVQLKAEEEERLQQDEEEKKRKMEAYREKKRMEKQVGVTHSEQDMGIKLYQYRILPKIASHPE